VDVTERESCRDEDQRVEGLTEPSGKCILQGFIKEDGGTRKRNSRGRKLKSLVGTPVICGRKKRANPTGIGKLPGKLPRG